MSRPTSDCGGPARPAGLLLLVFVAGLLFVGLPLAAQTITVTSTTPNMADQGTVGLVVTIAGQNFANGAKAAFYVTGTTNPGGITVKNVKYKNAKTLEATIDVAADAQTALKFDVLVTINGRTGKGTELFKVLVKVTGQDTTPPGSVMDLALPEIGFASFVASWTVPPDDAGVAGSGAAAKWEMRVRHGIAGGAACGPFTVENWEAGGSADPCYANGDAGIYNQPRGEVVRAFLNGLVPGTEYWVAVRTFDDAGLTPTLSEELSYQRSFTTAPAPDSPWLAGIVDSGPLLGGGRNNFSSDVHVDFDKEGNPAIVYDENGSRYLATFDGGRWVDAAVGPGISGGAFDFAFDPLGFATISRAGSVISKSSELRFLRRTGETAAAWQTETVAAGITSSNSLAFNPANDEPAILYSYWRGSSQRVRLAERRGSVWTNQDVPATLAQGFFQPVLAFDRDGNPGFALNGSDPYVLPGIIRFAFRENGAWRLETVDSYTLPGATSVSMYRPAAAFDPVRGDFAAAVVYRGYGADGLQFGNARYCERTQGDWTCQSILESRDLISADLGFGPDGAAYLALAAWSTLFATVRAPGGDWTKPEEYVDWNYFGPDLDLRVPSTGGGPGVVYHGYHNLSGVGVADSISFARRPAQ